MPTVMYNMGPPRYCRLCGNVLNRTDIYSKQRYDEYTGKAYKEEKYRYVCPKWYPHSEHTSMSWGPDKIYTVEF